MDEQAYLKINNIRYPENFDTIENIGDPTYHPIFELEGLSQYNLIPFKDEVEIYGKYFYYYEGDEIICKDRWELPYLAINQILNNEVYIWNGKDKVPKNVIVVEIEDGVKKIGYDTFSCCYYLTSIIIPNSVKEIGQGAFQSCHSLTSITIPNSAKSIGKHAFQSCIALTTITIPNSVEKIESYAFYFCRSLTSITIPDSVKEMGERVFGFCSNLQTIYVENPDLIPKLKKDYPDIDIIEV